VRSCALAGYLFDGESDGADVGGAHGDQRVEAVLPLAQEGHALVQGEQALDQIDHRRRNREQVA